MAEPSCLLDAPCTPRELMAVLGKARLCLAMRLHTLIFAARMAVPSMGLVYDPKVDSYLKELDLPAAGRVDSFDAQEAIRPGRRPHGRLPRRALPPEGEIRRHDPRRR